MEEVERVVANSLPDNFANFCDGWTAIAVHYFGVFASYYDHASKSVCSPLLAIAPLHDEAKIVSARHAEFISSTLKLFGKTLAAISALIADKPVSFTSTQIANDRMCQSPPKPCCGTLLF